MGDKSFEEPNAKSKQSVLLAGKGVRLTEPDESPITAARKSGGFSYRGIAKWLRHGTLTPIFVRSIRTTPATSNL